MVDEHDAHIRNTYAHNTWQYYTDSQYYGVKAFAIEVTENAGSRPFGDIYELHYKKDMEAVARNSFTPKTVDITFKPTAWRDEATRTFEVVEYNDNYDSILKRYGEVSNVKHNLNAEDEAKLVSVLADKKLLREKEAVPCAVNEYIHEMIKERFHGYGYLRDDMAFISQNEAYEAIKCHIPVHILNADNTALPAETQFEVDNALSDGKMIGILHNDKRLLRFYMAGNTLASLPFTHEALGVIYDMALDCGKSNTIDKHKLKVIDSIVDILDCIFRSDDGRDVAQLQLDEEHDTGEER